MPLLLLFQKYLYFWKDDVIHYKKFKIIILKYTWMTLSVELNLRLYLEFSERKEEGL